MSIPVRIRMRPFKLFNRQSLLRFYRRHSPYFRQYALKCFVILFISFVFVILACLNEDFVAWVRLELFGVDLEKLARDYSDESSIIVNTEVADKLYSQVKILCFILSTARRVKGPVAAVNATWAMRCNKVLYVLCPTEQSPDFLDTCEVGEGKSHLIGKVRLSLSTAYQKYLNEYDWFLKADDDTYIVVENLRYLLSNHNSDTPGYLGYHFKVHMEQGYMSGGAGYVISKQGLRQVVEDGFNQRLCAADGEVEDVEIGKCLQLTKVPVLSSLDKFNRQTFHTEKVWQHIWGTYPSFLTVYSKNDVKSGADCCSQFLVSFHHVDGLTMLMIHHLLYRTSVYGRNVPFDMPSVFNVKQVLPENKRT